MSNDMSYLLCWAEYDYVDKDLYPSAVVGNLKNDGELKIIREGLVYFTPHKRGKPYSFFQEKLNKNPPDMIFESYLADNNFKEMKRQDD